MPEIVPEKVVLVLSPPRVSWAAPKETAPEPRRDAMVWLLSFKVRFEERFTCEEEERTFVAVVARVPAEMVVAPP